MYGLLFPAVLGTVFVTFISEELKDLELSPRLIFGVIFLFHWVYEYSISTSPGKASTYQLYKFVSDLFIILAMYSAFYSLPIDYKEGGSYTSFYSSISAIGLIYIVTNIVRWKRFKEVKLRLTIIDIFLFFWGLFFVCLSVLLSGFNSLILAFIFLVGVATASIMSIFFARRH